MLRIAGRTLHRVRDTDHSASRILPPAFCAQRTGWTLPAPIPPLMLRAALAEVTGVRVFADQVDQPCPAEFMRELPGRGFVQPHQRRVQLELLGHAEVERCL